MMIEKNPKLGKEKLTPVSAPLFGEFLWESHYFGESNIYLIYLFNLFKAPDIFFLNTPGNFANFWLLISGNLCKNRYTDLKSLQKSLKCLQKINDKKSLQ